jgi:hypothetical protein
VLRDRRHTVDRLTGLIMHNLIWLALTKLETTLQLLSDCHQLDPCPEIGSVSFWDSKSPTATIDVPPVFPDRLEALLKQVY